EKFVGESEFQFRMISQVADTASLCLRGGAALHHERVSVIESQLSCRPHAEFGELISHFGWRCCRRCLENLFADRAGVFRIKPDLIAVQRLPEDDGAAHSLTVFDRYSGIFDGALCDFSEDVRLREFFRADQDWLG